MDTSRSPVGGDRRATKSSCPGLAAALVAFWTLTVQSGCYAGVMATHGSPQQDLSAPPLGAASGSASPMTTPPPPTSAVRSIPSVDGTASTHAPEAAVADTPGSYAYLNAWPGSAALRISEDYFVTVNLDPGPTSGVFFSNAFYLGGHQAFAGLQTTQTERSGQSGKVFLFSVWDTNVFLPGSAGSQCVPFDGGGSGIQCSYVYPWQVGHTYRFHLAAEGDGWFGMTVDDLGGADRFVLGHIQADPGLAVVDPGAWVQYVDYFEGSSATTTCGTAPRTSVKFDVTSTGMGNVVWPGVAYTSVRNGCGPYSVVDVPGPLSTSTHDNGTGNSLRGQVRDGGNCLNLGGAGPSAGSLARVGPCGSWPNLDLDEAWVYANDRSLRLVGNFCLDVPDQGTNLGIEPCSVDRALAQEWVFLDGFFASEARPGSCLDYDPSGQATLSPCSGSSRTWVLPTTP